jgi:hypothetical protein
MELPTGGRDREILKGWGWDIGCDKAVAVQRSNWEGPWERGEEKGGGQREEIYVRGGKAISKHNSRHMSKPEAPSHLHAA